MVARFRSKPQNVLFGSYGQNSVPYFDDMNTTVKVGTSDCSDVTGVGDNTDLHIHKIELVEGGRLNKLNNGTSSGFWFRDRLATYFHTGDRWQHIIPADWPGISAQATSAVARTTPSRPYVDMPVAIKELAEIPALLRDSGRTIINKMGGAHLKSEFGIKPLAGDIAKLVRWPVAFEKRMQEIERLFGARGLRRTIDIGKYSTRSVTNQTIHSTGIWIVVPVTTVTTVVSRAHVRWNTDLAIPNNLRVRDVMRDRLISAMLGMQGNLNPGHLSTLWESIPWSWLIDWNGGVGDWLMAKRNVMPAKLSSVRIMTHTYSEFTGPRGENLNGSGGSCSAFKVIRSDKYRQKPLFTTPSTFLPIIDSRRAGILSALLALLHRRR